MSDLPEVVEAPKTAKDRLIEKRDSALNMVRIYQADIDKATKSRDDHQQQADDLSEAIVALGHVNKP